MSGPQGNPTDQDRLRHLVPDRVWVGMDAIGGLVLYRDQPAHRAAIEYMRVLSRQEVDRLYNEGVDVMQLVNSLHRQIEGQRKHINLLEQRIAGLQEEVVQR